VKGTLGYGRTRGEARLSAAEARFGQHLFIIMWCLGRAPAGRAESPGTKLAFTRRGEEEEEEEEAAGTGKGHRDPQSGLVSSLPAGMLQSILSCCLLWVRPWGVQPPGTAAVPWGGGLPRGGWQQDGVMLASAWLVPAFSGGASSFPSPAPRAPGCARRVLDSGGAPSPCPQGTAGTGWPCCGAVGAAGAGGFRRLGRGAAGGGEREPGLGKKTKRHPKMKKNSAPKEEKATPSRSRKARGARSRLARCQPGDAPEQTCQAVIADRLVPRDETTSYF